MTKAIGWCWFALIQLAGLGLFVAGLPVCAYYGCVHPSFRVATSPITGKKILSFPHAWTWIWDNAEDGVLCDWYHREWTLGRRVFFWTALRNPANNFKYVVAWRGGPFYRWENRARTFYFQAGFNKDKGHPVLSAGAM